VSDVNLQLVREFFELNLFSVLTHWQHDSDRPRAVESGQQLFVENTHAVSGSRPSEFVLRAQDISAIPRAVVEVRAWHADRFYRSVIESSPVLAQFVSEDALGLARHIFGTPDFVSILVISELPASPENRARSVELLQSFGIGHVLEFPAILGELLEKVTANGNYASVTLQLLRLLKRYHLVQRQQLEFNFLTEVAAVIPTPQIETVTSPVDEE
jgi:hypothetical protein